jgi:4-alpha-glucanotransferase
MGFHRLFWIPDGVEARKGVYVRYPAEEFYAVLALESQRHQAWVVGEDLGTVPPEVRPAMRQHQLLRSFVAQYENLSDISRWSRTIPAESVASLNTHDMPPFAAFWGTRPDLRQALLQHLTGLAKSPAALAMINLEDLWLETERQNVPGTTDEFPNWRRKSRMSWEEIQDNVELKQILRDVDRDRKTP